MPKWSSYLTRFALLLIVCIFVISVFAFGFSTYFFSKATRDAEFSTLKGGIRSASMLLEEHAAGRVSRDEMKEILNPELSMDGIFFLLLDEEGKALAYTEEAVPYMGQVSAKMLKETIITEEPTLVRSGVDGNLAMIAGSRTENGFIFAGRTTQLTQVTAFSFRTRLLLAMVGVLGLILLLSTLMAKKVSRPARMITETASRLIEGDAVEVPEDMPGQEMREIARAFNHMSDTIASTIRELRIEKENMNLVLEGLNEGVVAVDGEGTFLHVNTAARELLGNEDSPEFCRLMEALSGQETEGTMRKGDQVLCFAVSLLPGDAEEGTLGKVALIRDVTREERLEKTRRDYVANISHELRTPLTSIRGLAEGLRDGMVTDEEDKKRYYNIITGEATRLSRLVNDLLELSSLQSNPASFEMEKVDPEEMLRETHDLNLSLFEKKKIRFLCETDQDLPVVVSNEDRLSQVLTVFLDNARKFTPEGGTVTLGARKEEDGVRFFVRDTGIGMDEETQKLAFERFHQAEAGRSSKGSGLGLSIAREILGKMGVEIRVDSRLGEGSTFGFLIPFGEK